MLHRPHPKHASTRRPRISHRKKFWLTIIAIPLLLMGTAAAYFALNTGTGSFQVSNAGFTITLQPATGPALAPGNGATQLVMYTVANNTSQTLTLNTETASVVTDANGSVFDTLTNTWNDSCLASWFSVTWGDGGIALPDPVVAGGSLTNGGMFITMPANTSINQSVCAGLSPEVQLVVT